MVDTFLVDVTKGAGLHLVLNLFKPCLKVNAHCLIWVVNTFIVKVSQAAWLNPILDPPDSLLRFHGFVTVVDTFCVIVAQVSRRHAESIEVELLVALVV